MAQPYNKTFTYDVFKYLVKLFNIGNQPFVIENGLPKCRKQGLISKQTHTPMGKLKKVKGIFTNLAGLKESNRILEPLGGETVRDSSQSQQVFRKEIAHSSQNSDCGQIISTNSQQPGIRESNPFPLSFRSLIYISHQMTPAGRQESRGFWVQYLKRSPSHFNVKNMQRTIMYIVIFLKK